MARELFGEVSTPSVKLGSRAWYTVPLSIAAHVAVTVVLILLPLASSELLPIPDVVMAFTAPVPLPAAPPAPAPPRTATAKPQPTPADTGVAPTEAPDQIVPERPAMVVSTGLEVEGGLGPGGAAGTPGVVNIPAPPPQPAPARAVTAPLPVGGNIKPPAKIRHVPPLYPTMAQQARVEGTVVIEAIIGIDGRVKDARIVTSKPLLDQAALDAVRQWQFTPTLLNGVPVPVIMTVRVAFSLQ